MNLFEEVRYRGEDEFLQSQDPILTDYFIWLSRELRSLQDKQQVRGILSLFPLKPRKTKFEVLPFYAFSTNRTAYATLVNLEDVFANFYIKTDIFPVINSIHHSYIENYKELPHPLVRKFFQRGALLYDNQI